MRTTHAILKMPDAMCSAWGLTPIGFPVRKRAVATILADDGVDLAVLLDESDRFLDDHPEAFWLHQDNMSLLAYYGAKAAAEAQDFEDVAHFAEVGLKYRPINQAHHAHLGLAKHCLGDLEGAIESYLYIVQHTHADADVLVRGFLAQALLELDRPFEGLLHCWPPPVGLEFDDTWFGLVAELADAAQVPQPTRSTPAIEAERLRAVLADVPGVGAAKQQAIIDRYRTLRALAIASHASIAQTSGMSDTLAARIYARLHPERIVDRAKITAAHPR